MAARGEDSLTPRNRKPFASVSRPFRPLVPGLIGLWLSVLPAGPVTAEAIDGATDSQSDCTTIEVFHRRGCPHCERAFEFLRELTRQHPAVELIAYDISQSFPARERFFAINRELEVERPGVPSFLVCDRFLIGFDTAATTGNELKRLLGLATAGETATATAQVDTNWLGTLDPAAMGLPLFTIALGLVDGFNPCAMWVLLFLLSLLLHLRDRRRIVMIAGTFVLVSGLVYFAFMAAWLNLFLLIGVSRGLQITVGLLAVVIAALLFSDFFGIEGRFSLSIPETAKPGIYARARRVVNADNLGLALSGVIVLAILVNLVELLCTAGLPAVYTQILASSDLSPAQYYGYLVLYNLAYILDDALMVGVVVYTLQHYKLGERYGRWLKLLSGVVVLLLGLMLLFKPEALI